MICPALRDKPGKLGLIPNTPGLAIEILRTADGPALKSCLLGCLLPGDGEVSLPLTQMQALTVIVRLLAVGTGDPTGDTLIPDALDPRAKEIEKDGELIRSTSSCTLCLQSPEIVSAILALLASWEPEFERGEEFYLRLEALRALRLVMSPEGDLAFVGAPHVEQHWWGDEDLKNGDLRRRLVETVLIQLQTVGDSMGQKLKLASLGCLWSLSNVSSFIRTRILQAGGTALVAGMLHSEIKQPAPIVRSTLVVECGILVSLAAGSRAQERQLAKLGVDLDLVQMLQRYIDYREIVCAGFVLLALLANEESISARLASSRDAKVAVSVARSRWPTEIEAALKANKHYVSPSACAFVKGTCEPNKRKQVTPCRNRPARAVATLMVK